jgi:hypothetical protein
VILQGVDGVLCRDTSILILRIEQGYTSGFLSSLDRISLVSGSSLSVAQIEEVMSEGVGTAFYHVLHSHTTPTHTGPQGVDMVLKAFGLFFGASPARRTHRSRCNQNKANPSHITTTPHRKTTQDNTNHTRGRGKRKRRGHSVSQKTSKINAKKKRKKKKSSKK